MSTLPLHSLLRTSQQSRRARGVVQKSSGFSGMCLSNCYFRSPDERYLIPHLLCACVCMCRCVWLFVWTLWEWKVCAARCPGSLHWHHHTQCQIKKFRESQKLKDSHLHLNQAMWNIALFSYRWNNQIKLFSLIKLTSIFTLTSVWYNYCTYNHMSRRYASTLTDALYHLSVYIQPGKWGRKSCPVIGHSVITVPKFLLLLVKQHSSGIAHCCRDKCSCLLVCKKERNTEKELEIVIKWEKDVCVFVCACMHVSDAEFKWLC